MKTLHVAASVLGLLAAACGDNRAGSVSITTPAQFETPLEEFVAHTPEVDLQLAVVDSPAVPQADDGGFQLALIDDASVPAEGFRIDAVPGTERAFTIKAHDILGAQYGVAAALEHLGVRFRHPEDTFVPFGLTPDDADGVVGVDHAPAIRVRGFHIHTLHPIEGYFAMWDPSPGADVEFRKIVDWAVKNRSNYIQWVGLNDILDTARHDQWKAQTQAMIDYAHARGVRVGLNIEVFSTSNLQLAFDLIDDASSPVGPQIAARLPLVTDGLPFDVYDLSFGEFFNAQPQPFIDTVNEATRQINQLAPQAEVHAIIHVGASQDVEYNGQTVPYYQLVKFADPQIVPDIHSVMYFNLFEDTGGAYGYADFHVQKDYLKERMCSNAKGSYHPEDAYWVAFDDSVPTFLPLYVKSRIFDLQQINAMAPPPCSPLDEHLVFSSGWEWGFWLQDTAVMHASYELPATPEAAVDAALAPDLGHDAASIVNKLSDAQHEALIDQELAAYVAARDGLIEAARPLGVVSQPDRVTFDDLTMATPAVRQAFADGVLAKLTAHGDKLDGLIAQLDGVHLPDTRWGNELRDGFAIDRTRVRFIVAAYQAVLAHLDGDDAKAADLRDQAADLLAQGQTIIARRHADLHDTHGKRLTTRNANATTYQFGYLFFGDTQCYWHRELDQVDGILGNSDVIPDACVL